MRGRIDDVLWSVVRGRVVEGGRGKVRRVDDVWSVVHNITSYILERHG